MKVAVTGGAGFIGHHLVAGLVSTGAQVQVVDDLSTGDRARLEAFGAAVRLTPGSVLDPAALDEAFTGCDVVYHQAAIASVARSLAEPRLVSDVNVSGTIEAVFAAARQGVRRIVLASSSAVYGEPLALPCREDQLALPLSPYGASKLAAEQMLHSLGRHLAVETVALRYFNVYGPGQDPRSEYAAVVPRFITAALTGTAPIVNGSGDISRDFIFVRDVVEANLRAAQPAVASGLTCNVASGVRTTLLDLLRAVGSAVGTPMTPTFGPPRVGDVRDSVADVSVAAERLGFRAGTSLERGIALTVESFRIARPTA